MKDKRSFYYSLIAKPDFESLKALGEKIKEFTVVGHKRICRFDAIMTKELVLKITSSRTEPTLRLLAVYE